MSSTTLDDRTNDKTTSTIATTATSTFSPELDSTPPMRSLQRLNNSNMAPSKIASACNQSPTRTRAGTRSKECPTSTNVGGALTKHIPKSMTATKHEEGVLGSPSLPVNWTQQHDRAICVLDARNYTLSGIVVKLRRTFPYLGGVLTTSMVDRRLRQLDQNIEIDYWRIGLRSKDANVGLLSPPPSCIPRPTSGIALKEVAAGSSRSVLPSSASVKVSDASRPMQRESSQLKVGRVERGFSTFFAECSCTEKHTSQGFAWAVVPETSRA